MYLLDTNVVSELRKQSSQRCHPNVTSWADRVDLHTTYLSAITVMEIELGLQQIARRDRLQADGLQPWFDEVLALYEQRIVPIDTAVALKAAALHVPDPKPERDALIAASAMVHGFTVVTRNTADFEITGVALLNPWETHS